MSNFMYGTCRSDEYLYISESNMLQIDSVVESTTLRLAACEAFEATNNEILVESVMEKIKAGWNYVCEKIKSFYNWVIDIVEKIKNWVVKKYNAAKEYLKKKLASKKDKKEPVTASFDPTCDFGLSISMESGYEIDGTKMILKNVFDVFSDDSTYNKFMAMYNKTEKQFDMILKSSTKDAIRKFTNDHEYQMKTNREYREDYEESKAGFEQFDAILKEIKEEIKRNTKDVELDIENGDFAKFFTKECDQFKKVVEKCKKRIEVLMDKVQEMQRKSQDKDKALMGQLVKVVAMGDKAMRPMVNATLHSLNTAQKAACAMMKQDAMKMTSPDEA